MAQHTTASSPKGGAITFVTEQLGGTRLASTLKGNELPHGLLVTGGPTHGQTAHAKDITVSVTKQRLQAVSTTAYIHKSVIYNSCASYTDLTSNTHEGSVKSDVSSSFC